MVVVAVFAFFAVIVMAVFAVAVFIAVIVVHIGAGKLDWIDAFTKRDNLGLICAGVVQELLQPSGLQVEAHSQYEIRIRYPGDVAGCGLEMVRVAAHRQQAEDFHSVSTYHASPVCDKVGSCYYLNQRRGWLGRLFGRFLGILVSCAG